MKGGARRSDKPGFVFKSRPARHIKTEFEQLVDAASDAVRVINSNFTIRCINRSFAEMTGVNQNEVKGLKCWDVFPSPLCRTADCRLQRILNGEPLIRVEIDRQKYNGATIPCMVTTSPLRNDDGSINGIIEQFRDITERRHMEEQVKESEERYKALIELGTEAGEAIVMLQDIDGREGIQTFISDQWQRLTGYSRQELLGTSFFNLISDRDKAASLDRHRQKMAGKAVPGIFEMNIICRDGKEITVELTGAFTSYQGKRANVIYLRDVTQRKILESKLDSERNRFRTLFEDVPVAIWEIDYSETKKEIEKLRAKGISDLRAYFLSHQEEFEKYFYYQKVLGINKACIKLWEAGSVRELLRRLYIILRNRPTRWARDIENIVLFAEGNTRINYDSIEETLKGNLKNVNIEYCIAPGYEETWARVFCSFFDITDRKKAEEELKKYQDNLEVLVSQRSLELKEASEKLEQLLDTERALRRNIQEQMQERIEFTRALVHELKTPLTPLIACSGSLLAAIEEEPQLSFARNISIGANKLAKKVDELLDLSRGEVGLLTINRRKINPLKLLKETIEYVRPVALKNEISLNLAVTHKLPPISIDRERIQQVLMNLLDNAIKYTTAKGSITILACADDDNLRIEVKDTGIGIDAEKQKYLFQPYKRLHVVKTRVGGLGLGLVLAKMIIDLHKGEIIVRSQKGYGSSFTIELPYRA